jgi:hypothetical protein
VTRPASGQIWPDFVFIFQMHWYFDCSCELWNWIENNLCMQMMWFKVLWVACDVSFQMVLVPWFLNHCRLFGE